MIHILVWSFVIWWVTRGLVLIDFFLAGEEWPQSLGDPVLWTFIPRFIAHRFARVFWSLQNWVRTDETTLRETVIESLTQPSWTFHRTISQPNPNNDGDGITSLAGEYARRRQEMTGP